MILTDQAIVGRIEIDPAVRRAIDRYPGVGGIAADQGGVKAGLYLKSASHEAADEKAAQTQAQSLQEQVKKYLEQSEQFEVRHGRLTVASTLLHMAIAIATLAIILGRRWPWFTALGLSALGLAVGAWAYF